MATRIRRALIVDDDEDARVALAGSLEDIGAFEIDQAAGLQEALERLARVQYDLVITDGSMPPDGAEAGLKVIAAVLAMPGPRPHLVMITGTEDQSLPAYVRGLGFGFVKKPGSLEAIASAVAPTRAA